MFNFFVCLSSKTESILPRFVYNTPFWGRGIHLVLVHEGIWEPLLNRDLL